MDTDVLKHLVLTRKKDQSVRIGDIVVTVNAIHAHKVVLGIHAPPGVVVDREEVAQRKERGAGSEYRGAGSGGTNRRTPAGTGERVEKRANARGERGAQ